MCAVCIILCVISCHVISGFDMILLGIVRTLASFGCHWILGQVEEIRINLRAGDRGWPDDTYSINLYIGIKVYMYVHVYLHCIYNYMVSQSGTDLK